MNLSNTYKIGSLISLKKGKKPNNLSSENVQGLMPYVDIKSFETGVIDKYTDGEKCVECKDGDLLIVCDGSRSGLIGKAIEGFVGSTLALIELDGRIDKNYLYYFIQGKYQLLNKNVKGTGTPHLKQDLLKSFEIAIPSLEIQKQIVQQIEERLSQLDSAVETLKKTKQQLEIYRQAVLKKAFDGNLTNSGKAKNDILKKYIEKPKYGTSKKCSYLADDTYKPVYRIPNINTKTARIVHTDIKYAHFDKKELETIRLQNNDLLIIRSNGSVSLVGRVALVTDDDTQGTFAGYLMRLRIINQQMLFPKYLLWYLQSKSAREYIERKAKSTSGVNNINSEEISNLTIPYYNLQSQKEIVEAIESRISIFDSIQQVVTTSLQQAEALRQSILKQAFEGML